MTDEAIKQEAQKRISEIACADNILSDSLTTEISKLVALVEVDSIFLEEAYVQQDPSVAKASVPDLIAVEKSRPDDIRQIILEASLPQKIKLALLGNATCRMLLIRDSNRMIQQFVLKNPRLQPTEVEDFAKNPNLSEVVLRSIASNSQWMKSYSLKYTVVCNPKMPQDVSIKWVKFLSAGDLKKIAKSKNIPNVVAITARKRLADKEKN